MEYNFKEVEEKCKKHWDEINLYKVENDPAKPKYYVLDMFPYPSGAGLHVGHPLGYVGSDIYARYKRLKGFNVLHPMGFDAFGLPAEQYAIETGTHPAVTTEKNLARYREQLDNIGFSFDWSRAVKTSDPNYYKWTQWIFLKLFNSWYNKEANKAEALSTLLKQIETSGIADKETGNTIHQQQWNTLSESEQQRILMQYRLAYQSYTEVNWCPALGTVLANDEVKDGKSERGGHPVERKKMRQWSLRITEYADRLLQGLETIDWSEPMKDMQRNWIGKSEGALVQFAVKDSAITVFTTRPDTIFGATFLVLAPEHELVKNLVSSEQKEAVAHYLSYVKSRSDIERQQEKKVTGVFTGSYATHPFTQQPIPVWIAEYVLINYGTGAIMAVPADDERDHKFAEKFALPIVTIIDKSKHPNAEIGDKVGTMIHSDFLNGLEVKEAIQVCIKEIEKRKIGTPKINYRLRDAGYSRQRYWGEPMPIVYKDNLPYALDESQLPLVLPEIDSYKPTGDGRSPIANNAQWVAQNLETDTMPGYAGSSWYFLRYMDPHNNTAFASKEALDYWQQVDLYVGGTEHAVGHLLYARFWTKFLYDLGYIHFDEPFKKLVNQGFILGRSSLMYRSDNQGSKPEFNYFAYYVSKNIAKLIADKDDSILNQLNLINKSGTRSINKAMLGTISPSPLHVDINYVKNDLLEVERLIHENERYQEAEFITEPDGTFLCDSLVEKMSKSLYNVVNPDDMVREYGADCLRMYLMFLGPLEQAKPWDTKGINGVSNFLRKFWRLFSEDGKNLLTDAEPTNEEYKVLHKTLKKVSEDIERLSFNTAVSAFMICVNELGSLHCHKRAVLHDLVIALAPFAPFITEELWLQLGNKGSVHTQAFPLVNEQYLVESSFNYPVSINGKVRANVPFALDLQPAEIEQQVLALEQIQKYTEGKPAKKFVFVKGKIINIVI